MTHIQSTPAQLDGLSDREAAARRAAGKGNDVPLQTSRTYWDIFRDNLFTFINGVYFFLSLVLISLGRASDVIVLAFVILLNVIVNVVQEIRAKKKLDKIALVTRPKAIVIRAGQERVLDPTEIVLGDILSVQPGDQIVVDGRVVGAGEMKVDESLLTGESDQILKRSGDPVYSGSFCVSGTVRYEAEKVGAESLANRMTAEARKFRKSLTPLQQRINLMIRLLLGVAILLGLTTSLQMLLGVSSITRGVQNLAVIIGLVPSGLYLMITLAYTFGAVRIAQQNALIQQANAVESISHVDVMCLDKTGTLTTNRINLQNIHPLGIEQEKLAAILGDYAASVSTSNKTNEAIVSALPGAQRPLKLEVPFGSAHKWSAIAFEDADGMYILGAPEILGTAIELTDDLRNWVQSGADKGLRVLLFAFSPNAVVHEDAAGNPLLPPNLQPLGILEFGDELRPDAHSTLEEFRQAGIQIKVISGDNPLTVAALAKQAGLSDDIIAVSGQDLAQMTEAEFTQTAEESTIFGRITPEQKANLVKSLQSRGHYVAMMGDGVNDVLSLKQANVGIAMESGSQATRGVADIMLIKDSFSALPKAFLEGQRINNGVADISKLFMVRIFSFILVIVAVGMITFSFPFGIKTSTIVTFLTVGIPPFFVTLWAKPGKRSTAVGNSFLHFVVPTTLMLSLASIGIYVYFYAGNIEPVFLWLSGKISFEELSRSLTLQDFVAAQAIAETAMITMQVFAGLLLLPFLKPPSPAWVGGEPLSRDRRFSILAGLVLAAFLLVLSVPFIRNFFELQPLSLINVLAIGLVALVWALVVRFMWRHRTLDHFLGIKISPF
ncbi:MAG: HAD-IC family P-type ATPase [Leptolyngbyaceae cyanobacterium bins.302]|nr:HAD-IC family P-type ATPase [Leptolyngbyaceae cyanobacterium bins.302]